MREFRAILKDLRRQPLRNVLTAVTMLMGVLSLIAVSAASSVATDMMLAVEEQRNGRAGTFEVTTNVPSQELVETGRDLSALLNNRLGGAGAAVVSVETPTSWRPIGAAADQSSAGQSLPIEWSSGEVNRVRRLPLLEGTWPAAQSYPPRVVINEAAAEGIGYPGTRQVVVFPGMDGPSMVVGISGVVADGEDSPRAFGAIEELSAYRVVSGSVPLRVRVTMPSATAEAVQQFLSDAFVDLGVVPNEEARRVDTVDQVAMQLEGIQLIFTLFAALMLVVAALGILNVGLASVRERSRELVVRRALGARRRTIFVFVMGEEVLVAMGVAIVALAIGLAAVYLILPAQIPPRTAINPPPFPWSAGALGMAAAIATAMIGSAAPAWKAARLPVSRALRE